MSGLSQSASCPNTGYSWLPSSGPTQSGECFRPQTFQPCFCSAKVHVASSITTMRLRLRTSCSSLSRNGGRLTACHGTTNQRRAFSMTHSNCYFSVPTYIRWLRNLPSLLSLDPTATASIGLLRNCSRTRKRSGPSNTTTSCLPPGLASTCCIRTCMILICTMKSFFTTKTDLHLLLQVSDPRVVDDVALSLQNCVSSQH
jgi:hypothetical protein